MRVEFYGLTFDSHQVSFHLWSPWRASALEHRLFEAIRVLPRVENEDEPDEWKLHLRDSKTFKAAMGAVVRVLKGWQEDADPHMERRTWRWMLEADSDDTGYDHSGEPVAMWGFLRLSLDRGSPEEPDKGEDIDLNGFGLQIWGEVNGKS
jgi:hypothetical protein